MRANATSVPVIIIDMRNNGGGNGFLADQMAAYFFDEAIIVGNSGRYDPMLGAFYFDDDYTEIFYLPSAHLRYHGRVVVLVSPNCASACELFSYNLTLQDRATVVGYYPTAGFGGGVEQFLRTLGIRVQMTIARSVDADGNIHTQDREG